MNLDIHAAVQGIFDQYPGESIPESIVTSLAVIEMRPTPYSYNGIKEEVRAYLREQLGAGGLLHKVDKDTQYRVFISRPSDEWSSFTL
jgi:hypothetical protein